MPAALRALKSNLALHATLKRKCSLRSSLALWDDVRFRSTELHPPSAGDHGYQAVEEYGFSMESRNVDHLMRVPDHALGVVQELSKSYQLGLVTSRRNAFMNEVYSRYPQNLFPVVVTIEDIEKHKPDPEPLLLAAKELHVSPEQCVYIDDMPSDVAAGHAAGMKVIAYSKVEIPGADAQTDTFTDIPNLITLLD